MSDTGLRGKIREWISVMSVRVFDCRGLEPPSVILAALDAYAEAVRADERERNCRAMCDWCADGIELIGTEHVDGSACEASAIRAQKDGDNAKS
jgi:hypothetical protein